MTTPRSLRVAALALPAFLIAVGLHAQGWDAAIELPPFLPAPPSGVLDRLPGDSALFQLDQPVSGEGPCVGGEAGTCMLYANASVRRVYYVADSALVRKAAPLVQQIRDVQSKMMKGEFDATMMQRAQMSALALDSVKRQFKPVGELTIKLNDSPWDWRRDPNGMVKGRPAFKAARSPDGAYLFVFVGPNGFTNLAPHNKNPKPVLRAVKGILVSVESSAQTLPLAQRLLDSVDYDGLAKLLQP